MDLINHVIGCINPEQDMQDEAENHQIEAPPEDPVFLGAGKDQPLEGPIGEMVG